MDIHIQHQVVLYMKGLLPLSKDLFTAMVS